MDELAETKREFDRASRIKRQLLEAQNNKENIQADAEINSQLPESNFLYCSVYSICTFIDVQCKKRKIRSESGKENALRTRNQLNKKMACFVGEYFGMPTCEISQRGNDE